MLFGLLRDVWIAEVSHIYLETRFRVVLHPLLFFFSRVYYYYNYHHHNHHLLYAGYLYLYS